MNVQYQLTSPTAELTAEKLCCPDCESTEYLLETISTKFEGRAVCVTCETAYHFRITTAD